MWSQNVQVRREIVGCFFVRLKVKERAPMVTNKVWLWQKVTFPLFSVIINSTADTSIKQVWKQVPRTWCHLCHQEMSPKMSFFYSPCTCTRLPLTFFFRPPTHFIAIHSTLSSFVPPLTKTKVPFSSINAKRLRLFSQMFYFKILKLKFDKFFVNFDFEKP